ncbi:MAG: hypothetical protein ACTFAK_12195 [Candidatus Electronema sp. VV]
MCDDFLYHHNVLTHHFLFYHYQILAHTVCVFINLTVITLRFIWMD